MSSTPTESPSYDPSRLVLGALVFNALIFVVAVAVFVSTRSQLVLAQGSDSLFDIGAGVILALSIQVGRKPSDSNHPYGHDRAEPIGALVAAILAGVLAFEVLRSAATALATGELASLDSSVAWILGGKLVFKFALMLLILPASRKSRSSALEALRVDTRNDLVACASSLIGYSVALAGFEQADAILAIPVAFYIGKNGFDLARENLRFLMGEAPDAEVLVQLRELGGAIPGVIALGELTAQYVGPHLHVEVDIEIGSIRSASEAHDISVLVQRAIESHELVGKVFVHVDVVDC
jgi:cation diffusion facilitator family transporter